MTRRRTEQSDFQVSVPFLLLSQLARFYIQKEGVSLVLPRMAITSRDLEVLMTFRYIGKWPFMPWLQDAWRWNMSAGIVVYSKRLPELVYKVKPPSLPVSLAPEE